MNKSEIVAELELLSRSYKQLEDWSGTMVADFQKYQSSGNIEDIREQVRVTVYGGGAHDNFLHNRKLGIVKLALSPDENDEKSLKRSKGRALEKIQLLEHMPLKGFPGFKKKIPETIKTAPPHKILLAVFKGEVHIKFDKYVWMLREGSLRPQPNLSSFSFKTPAEWIIPEQVDGIIKLEKFVSNKAEEARKIVFEAIGLLE